MEMDKITTNKPIILAASLVVGIGIGMLGHKMMSNSTAENTQSCAALDMAGLNQLVADNGAAVGGGQPMALLGQHAKDSVNISSSNDDWAMNRDALLMNVNDFFKGKPTATYTPKTQYIGCNVAWSLGHRVTNWTDVETKAKMERNTRYTMIFRHEQEGWKIAHVHFSVAVPHGSSDLKEAPKPAEPAK